MTDGIDCASDKEELRDTIAEILDVPTSEVTDSAHFVDDLDVDSLLALEIAVVLEKKYGVQVAESEMKRLTCFQQVYELLRSRRGRAS
ncbi:acyl carrier protein [Streptomyces cupreus]|uniref:Acyl carrier protein n=1 Tax=Streptomyces cupreus TaxID=2759956 RepID=A0A7X1J5T9_9ACTN|nr:acyl carrier protein [Streptomyces cupreus]MBC2903692.1 acyl carrier protein [Streptomyces cupreus]